MPAASSNAASAARFEGTDRYVATEDLKLAVNAALTLQRPLLIKGEPGTGKTMLAEEVARALGRPLIAQLMVRVAREHDAVAVAHGCTGKGNDQVRFEVGVGALAPDLSVMAPVRDSGMTRDKAIAFAAESLMTTSPVCST